MNAGGAGQSINEPLRVRLVAAARPEARPAHTERPGRTERPSAARQPRLRTPPPAKKQPPAPEPERIIVARARPAETKEADPEPAAKPLAAADTRPAEAAAPAPKPRVDESTGSAAAGPARLARGVAPGKSAAPRIEAAAALLPVRYARTTKPRYPGKARRAGWEGTAVLKVLVDSRGAPDRVTVDRTSGFEILDAAAVKAVGRWRFHPARRGGDSVASWVRIPVAFKLKEDQTPH
jgi:protein TonB